MRFVIINLPPPADCRTIEALRRPLNEAFGAREALRYPPHITLRTGLVCPDDQADAVAGAFLAHARTLAPVEVRTQGLFFATYGGPPVDRGMVGWSVEPTDALLGLHRGLLGFTDWQKGPQGSFQPHLSLAYHDLAAADVEPLRQRLSGTPVPDFAWTLDRVALYHETDLGWVEWASGPLG